MNAKPIRSRSPSATGSPTATSFASAAAATGHRDLIQTLGTPSATNDQRYAYDIVAVDQDGNSYAEVDGDCEEIEEPGNTDALMWGQQVVAIAAGNIVNLDIGSSHQSPAWRQAGGYPARRELDHD